MDKELDKDTMIRFLDRQLKLRALLEFEEEARSLRELEREFAEVALEMVRRQPAMSEGLGTAEQATLPALPYERPTVDERH